ncbi:mono/diheme cytochrome c family protein [Saonia flava]|uniref:Mono/diheme cytochrome c family protein n=1 Tax=Saonia flava TaxID=523696 RepID=A0A846QVY5_9FLAO|nr:discoidin domain-containing protein [Saonia flava]NJB71090.1 mono/diheme cytochrome c family protein [Saonia flava]
MTKKAKYRPCCNTRLYPIFLLLLIPFFQNCAPKEKGPTPVETVIASMDSVLPVIELPENADPENRYWKGIDLEPKEPVLPLYPEEQQKLFILPEGYGIEPVLSEPQIEQPGAISFDGNGRMYVLELRSYMLTADSDNTLEPISRISRWEDKDNDGVYETGTTFVDNLIFPRFVLPYGKDCVLAMESDADDVYKYTDTDGDGKADKKEFFTNKYGRSGNVEHQQSFMYWGMDNWLYSTMNAFRVKETPDGVIREKTGFNRAQWGVTHDDDGKLWFQGGSSGLPSYFQFPIVYGTFDYEDQFAEGFEVPWGAPVKIEDMQGGMAAIRRPDGSLNRVTGSSGNDVYRGDRLPKEVYGQYFYGEPVARIVRQINPVVREGLTQLHNVYQDQKSEFLKSTDPLFRPVDMATAPDGSMYIVDMYHGIIQEGQWAQKGSYLRAKIEQYQLDKVIRLGRVWRITHNDMERDKTQPRMFEETPAELVEHLGHPNGWWRDKAQQLIVMSKDLSVVPKLEALAKNSKNPLERTHALWSLEGLGAISGNLVKSLLADSNPKIRIQALRVGESVYKKGDKSLTEDFYKLFEDENVDVVIQAMMSANLLKMPSLKQNIEKAMKNNKAKGVQFVGEKLLEPPVINSFFINAGPEITDADKEILEEGATIFNELCVTCHGNNGTGIAVGDGLMAPPLAGSLRVQGHPDYSIKTVLRGMTGPMDGKTYAGGIMVGNIEQSDDWIAAIVSYIRINLTNEAPMVTAEDVARVRAATAEQTVPYTYSDLMASVPQLLEPTSNWKVTSSHKAPNRIGGKASTLSAFNLEGWTTGEKQKNGMYFQVEFPEETKVTELHFICPNVWRGRRLPPLDTFPRAFEIQVSQNGTSWSTVYEGVGEESDMKLSFEPTSAKFLRIELSKNIEGEDEIPWTMREMEIYGLIQ